MMLEKHGIRGKYIIQCKGDAVYIPSGAIHQVLNINSCIKIACDFISPQARGSTRFSLMKYMMIIIYIWYIYILCVNQ